MNSKRTRPPASGDGPLLHGVDWAVRAGVADEVMLGARRLARRRRQRRAAVAGLLGVAAIALGLSLGRPALMRPAAAGAAASAVVSMPARQVLPDGTVVELKEGAHIAVHYSPGVRRVVLERGEAHFQVMHDTARPFVVAVDSVEVRAVGTAFSVQRGAAAVEVVVTTGRVAVDRAADNSSGGEAPAPQTLVLLDAGNCTRVDVAERAAPPVVAPLSAAELEERLAWRTPRLEFTRTPLSEAIPMINQHSATKLALADTALGQVRISGLLRVDNIEALFRLLETEHGIVADRTGAGDVVLRPRR